MTALALIQQLQQYLASDPLIASANVGVSLPLANSELPTIVLELHDLSVPSVGLGQHVEVVSGALQTQTVIDLANPMLNDGSGFSLISQDRLIATLLHGGLVDSQGSTTPLQATDIQASIDDNPLTLNQNTPANGEFSVAAIEGQLTFGDPLPLTGTLRASYFIGQWQRIVNQLGGEISAAVFAINSIGTETLSNDLIGVMANAHLNITGLRALDLRQLNSISSLALGNSTARQRQLNWQFEFEHIVNQPESSGGIIQRIILRTRRDSFPFEKEDIT